MRIGKRWDMVLKKRIKREEKGEIVELDIDKRIMEKLGKEE